MLMMRETRSSYARTYILLHETKRRMDEAIVRYRGKPCLQLLYFLARVTNFKRVPYTERSESLRVIFGQFEP